MNEKPRRFQFTVASLLRSTLFAGLAAGSLVAARSYEFHAKPLYVFTCFFGAMAIVALIGKVSLPRWLERVSEVALIAVALFVLFSIIRQAFVP